MWPVLFSVFGIQIQSYGVSKALAALVAAWLLGRAFRKLGFPVDQAHSLVLWAAVWGFVAAKVYFLIDNRAQFSWHLLGSSGFVWYGGLIGGILTVVVLTRRYRLPLASVAGATALPLSVAYGIGRIGCFLAGDGTYGTPTDLPWGMAFPDGVVPVTVPVHPAQLSGPPSTRHPSHPSPRRPLAPPASRWRNTTGTTQTRTRPDLDPALTSGSCAGCHAGRS